MDNLKWYHYFLISIPFIPALIDMPIILRLIFIILLFLLSVVFALTDDYY